MPKVTIDDTRGLFVEAGKGFTVQSPPTYKRNNLTTNSGSIQPGLNVIPNGTTKSVFVFPSASNHAGQVFVVRNETTIRHILSASNVDQTMNIITDPQIAGGVGNKGDQEGARLTFGELVGSVSKYGSVTLMCDGFGWSVMASSGSYAIGDTP